VEPKDLEKMFKDIVLALLNVNDIQEELDTVQKQAERLHLLVSIAEGIEDFPE